MDVKILDLTHFKDREGRWTLFGYDALRQRTASVDPLGRITRFHWCYCGALQDLWDAEGNKTHWDYDFTGRLTKKTYADGKETNYTYQPLTGWLDTVTDARSQVKTHSYFLDGNLQGIAYTNSAITTPNVSFTYDPIYGRLATMTDGTGTTSYAYHPVDGTTLGAGNLHTIDGPLTNDTIAHTYDSLGRPKTQSINGAANTSTVNTYDALSRVTQFTNPLGVFNQTYDPVNLMPKLTTAPNGLTTAHDYHPAAADLRLKEIKYTLPSNVALSKHVYTYNPEGNIKSWAQTLDTNPAKTWVIAYSKADQLEAATQTQSGAVIALQAFRFDRIGNITSNQNGSKISKGSYNNRSQLNTQEPGGWMRVRGTTDEGASVRVKSNANPFTNATTTSTNEFAAWVQANPGANTVTVEAKDDSPDANTRTKSWSVNINGQNRVPSYDLNGNTTANGMGQSYQWDAENRLVKITYADGSKTEFTYDGLSRRTRITERYASNTIASDKRYVWLGGNQPAEERDATTNAVTKRFFAAGEQRLGGSDAGLYFYAKDHLGSVREVINYSGNLATRYDYELWGKRVRLSGTIDTEVGYTGHHHHEKSGLVLTWYRAYDTVLGRWLSPDPIGEAGGLNLYEYAGGDPINVIDPYGLDLILLSPRLNGREGNDHLIARFRIHANNKRMDSNEFEVHGHGDESCENVFDDRNAIPKEPLSGIRSIKGAANRKVISAKQLADLIEEEGSWKPGMPVTLFICNTGVIKIDGTDNFAKALAKELAERSGVRQEVRAPNGTCSIAKEPPYTPNVITVPPNDKRDPKFYSSYANP